MTEGGEHDEEGDMGGGKINGSSSLKAVVGALAMVGGAAQAAPSGAAAVDPGRRSTIMAEDVLDAVVGVAAKVPREARTAAILSTERVGSGLVIDRDGLVVTVGYVIMEAEQVVLITRSGNTVPADVVAYDNESGFGLVRARRDLGINPIPLGVSKDVRTEDPALVISFGDGAVTPVRVVSRRPFAGYWEYYLDEALFTAPPHAQFGGAGLIGADGRLLGVGSLVVGDAPGTGAETGSAAPGNMFIPVDLLKQRLAMLMERGLPEPPHRPWLGLYAQEVGGLLVVTGVAPDGPAAKAGIRQGWAVVGVNGQPVKDLADLYRKVWSVGGAGAEIPLDMLSAGEGRMEHKQVKVNSTSRYDWLINVPRRN